MPEKIKHRCKPVYMRLAERQNDLLFKKCLFSFAKYTFILEYVASVETIIYDERVDSCIKKNRDNIPV